MHVLLIERNRRVGRGLAYGACAPEHLLNVPVSRMELGRTPGFAEWLGQRRDQLGEALAESDGDLAAAFVPRELFGTYLEERVQDSVSKDPAKGFNVVRGEAVGLADFPERGVLLADGREIKADIVVLATGNLPPRPPGAKDAWLYDTAHFVPDVGRRRVRRVGERCACCSPRHRSYDGRCRAKAGWTGTHWSHARSRGAVISHCRIAPAETGPSFTIRSPSWIATGLAMRQLRGEAEKAAAQNHPLATGHGHDAAREAAGVWSSWSEQGTVHNSCATFVRAGTFTATAWRRASRRGVWTHSSTFRPAHSFRAAGGVSPPHRRAEDGVEVVLRERSKKVAARHFPRLVSSTAPARGAIWDRLALPIIAGSCGAVD